VCFKLRIPKCSRKCFIHFAFPFINYTNDYPKKHKDVCNSHQTLGLRVKSLQLFKISKESHNGYFRTCLVVHLSAENNRSVSGSLAFCLFYAKFGSFPCKIVANT
jgi:hypothetical protein